MAIPEGYEKLAVIGIAYKGEYNPDTVYGMLNAVYYDGSTYVALRDNPTGAPVPDGVNWQYMAKGFMEGVLSAIDATDTSGLLGEPGAVVDAQDLLDVIADKVADKLVAKAQLVNNGLTTEEGFALDARYGKTLADGIAQTNGKMPVILAGYNVTDSGTGIVDVTFTEEFQEIPTVMTTIMGTDPKSLFTIKISNVTTQGFRALCVYINTGSTVIEPTRANFYWIAVSNK